ncbi:MAG: LysE family translocator [Rhodospirillaceae bacterium]|jgi:threonine/homoserine/homoserine lactone efflux protein|nr:LysE family translocator [Rhodospirillaceae bacterium]
MFSAEYLLLFTLAAIALGASPGPSNLYVLGRTAAQGTVAGVVSSLGLAAGGMVHALAAAFGLSALFVHSPAAFAAVKFAGAAYLAYLGLRLILAREAGDLALGGPARRGTRRLFVEGAMTEVLNPKTALFFIAFLPQFVDPVAGPVWLQMLVLGAIVPVAMLPCDLIVALTGGALAGRLARSAGLRRALNRVSGSVLIGLGLRVALEEGR